MYKNIIVVTSIVVFSILIALSFWKYDLQYSQPTPLPENYQKVEFGSRPMGDSTFFPENKAVLLHFFNPDCPCSRFHIASFKSLVNSNKDSVNIYTILQVEANQVSEEFKKYDLNIPVLIDQLGSSAKALNYKPSIYQSIFSNLF